MVTKSKVSLQSIIAILLLCFVGGVYLFQNIHLRSAIQKVLLRDEGVPRKMFLRVTTLYKEETMHAFMENKPYPDSVKPDKLLLYVVFSDENGKQIRCSGTVKLYALVSSEPFPPSMLSEEEVKAGLLGRDTVRLFEGHINPSLFVINEQNILGVETSEKVFCKEINIMKTPTNAEEKAVFDAKVRFDHYVQKQDKFERKHNGLSAAVHQELDIIAEFYSDKGGSPLCEKYVVRESRTGPLDWSSVIR